jgi:restriction endonuclease S subunit
MIDIHLIKYKVLDLAFSGFLVDSSYDWNDERKYKYVWEVTFWNKKFQNVSKEKQKVIIDCQSVLAGDFPSLEDPNGDILLLSTGLYRGFTTKEKLSGKYSTGEIVSIPGGGSPIVKYYYGNYVTADNRIAISSSNDILIIKYFYYFLLFKNDYLDSIVYRGVGLRHPEMKKVLDMLIPLPSIEEQKRIVDKLDEIFAELDKIDEKKTTLQSIRDKMKSKILKLAIQGKLVEQRSEEGTGEELFELIQQEKQQLIMEGKIKKEKLLPAIEDSEIPFKIPSTWKWCKFGQLIFLTSGVDLEPKDYYPEPKEASIPYITGASCVDENGKLIINRFTNKTHTNSSIGDILLTCKGTIGKISTNDKGDMHLARQLMGIKTFLNFDFTKYYLMFIVDELKTKANGLIPGIDRPTVLNYYIPLPPIEEQKRIVRKLDEVLLHLKMRL